MNDLISRQEAIRLYCREHCGWEPEKCPLTYERDGTEECSFVRLLKELPSVQPVATDMNVVCKNTQLTPEELGQLNDYWLKNINACNIIPEQKRGKWILKDKSALDREPEAGEKFFCDQCGEMALGYPFWLCDLKPSNFCPNCGAKMDGGYTDD